MSDMLDKLLKACAHSAKTTRAHQIRKLISANAASLNRLDSSGRTCLHHALGRLDDLHVIIDELLSAGASPNVAENCNNGLTPLMIAAQSRHDNRDVVKKLLCRAGGDVDKADLWGWTSLHHAARCGRAEIVRELLAAGASPHLKTSGGSSALYYLAVSSRTCEITEKQQRMEIAQQLIAAGADVNETGSGNVTCLHSACYSQDIEMVELLLSHGASLSAVSDKGYNALHFAAFRGNVELVRRLVDAGADVNFVNEESEEGTPSALHVAIYKDHPDVLEYLLERGADPNCANSLGMSVLSFAITTRSASHQDRILELLLSHGADLYDGGIGQTKTPFEILVSEGRSLEARLFLENGLDLARYNPRISDDFSPLHQAISLDSGNKMLKLLLKYNSQGSLNLYHKDKDGNSPLCVALQKKSLDCVRLLLTAGANVNRVDSKGRTPLEFIAFRNLSGFNPGCIQLLVEAGAKVDKALRELVPDAAGAAESSNKSIAKDRLELARLIVKCRVLHENLSPDTDPTDYESAGVSAELQSYHKACEAEIIQLKESPLLEPITYFDVLTADEEFYKSLADDLVFEKFNEYSVKRRFPLYAEVICKRFKSLRNMYGYWEEAVKNLRYIANPVLAAESSCKSMANVGSAAIEFEGTESASIESASIESASIYSASIGSASTDELRSWERLDAI